MINILTCLKVNLLSKKLLNQADKHHFHYLQSWNGEAIIQTPDDIISIIEIIFKTRPEVIIETGVARGGSLAFYASILKLLGSSTFLPFHSAFLNLWIGRCLGLLGSSAIVHINL